MSLCALVSSLQPSGGYCHWNLLTENMTCQLGSQTVFIAFIFPFLPRLSFSAQLAFVLIVQHFSACRILSIFIKVKPLSTAASLPLVPPFSFHLSLISLPTTTLYGQEFLLSIFYNPFSHFLPSPSAHNYLLYLLLF